MSCFECDSTDELHDHHVVPRIYGGARMVQLCYRCHALVHDKKAYKIKALTKKALQAMKRRGEYTGGRVPYGKALSADGVRLVDCPAEQAVIAAVRECRAAGLNLRETSERLESKGFKTRKGGSFSPTQVSRLEAA